MERMLRRARRTRPALESLEGRQLLSVGGSGHPSVGGLASHATFLNRQLSYRTPQGTRVSVYLHGFGKLVGSSLTPEAP